MVTTITQTDIVVVNVTQTVAPTPNTLQRMGALVSQGGTTLPPNSKALLTQPSDLTPLLAGAIAVTSAVWATGVVTVTTTTPHGFPNGETLNLTLAGFTPAAYNGLFACTITGVSTFTFPLVNNPGSTSVIGTVTDGDVAELVNMVTTFFAQGSSVPVYVLELGDGNAADGIASLTTYLTNNPLQIYGYLVPTEWAADVPSATALATLARNHANNTSMVYFYITATTSSAVYGLFTTIKSCLVLISSPTAAATEFQAATMLYRALSYQPSATNRVAPMAYAFVFGVTAYDITGPLAVAYRNAYVNWIATGAEGGISNTILKWGTTADGRDFTYWYAVDWAQINLKLDLANEIINGSNNPLNPLYYNQQGIKRLQVRAQAVLDRGVSFGLIFGAPQVSAVNFNDYTTQNPSDYKLGTYNGLSATVTPARGFIAITFNLNVTDFVAQ